MTESTKAAVFWGGCLALLGCVIGASWYWSNWWPIGIVVGGLVLLYILVATVMKGFNN